MNETRLTGPAASVYVGGLMRNHAGVNASALRHAALTGSPAQLRRLLFQALHLSRRTLARIRHWRSTRRRLAGRVAVASSGDAKPRPRSTRCMGLAGKPCVTLMKRRGLTPEGFFAQSCGHHCPYREGR